MQPTLASVPGALVFRALLTMTFILILITIFFRYVDGTQKQFEREAIAQTKRIIDSSLAVAFATFAVKHRLDDLNELDGGNPFILLRDYQLLPVVYQGEIDFDPDSDLAAGWYYLKHRRLVLYKTHHLDRDHYFALRLNYLDVNGSGRFESSEDNFQNLQFIQILDLPR